MTIFSDFQNILKSCNNITISAHVNPDGDAVASCIALGLALDKMGKDVVILLEDYGDRYSFLKSKGLIFNHKVEGFKNELFVCLDCGDKSRLGKFVDVFDSAKITFNIDHHITNDKFAMYNYVFDKSSTCEIVYELLMHLGISLNDEIAKALYTGIAYDTGGFKYTNTTARTYEIAAELVEYDFSFTDIFKQMFDTRSYASTKLLGRALERAELFFKGKVAVSYLTLEDMNEFNADSTQAGGIIDHLRNIKGVHCSVFIYEKGIDEAKVSMRSDGTVNISKIASEFGGGGHLKACGCTIKATAQMSKQIIIDKIKSQLDNL